MASHKRTAIQREHDLATIGNLYLLGWTQAAIGEKLGLTKQQISYDLKELQQRWLQSALIDFHERKMRELAKWDLLERTYQEAWERSCEHREIKSTEKTTSPKKMGEKGKCDAQERLKAAYRTEGRDGNVEFLKGIERCIHGRSKLLGLLVDKVAPTDPSGEKPYEQPGLTEEEGLARIMALYDSVRARAAEKSAKANGGGPPSVDSPAGPPDDGVQQQG
jgi:hypothetical protein